MSTRKPLHSRITQLICIGISKLVAPTRKISSEIRTAVLQLVLLNHLPKQKDQNAVSFSITDLSCIRARRPGHNMVDTLPDGTPQWVRRLCRIRLSAIHLDATIFIGQILRFQMLGTLRCFRLFNTPTIRLHFSPVYSPIPYRPTLVASYAPSDPPRPLFTSVFSCRCR